MRNRHDDRQVRRLMRWRASGKKPPFDEVLALCPYQIFLVVNPSVPIEIATANPDCVIVLLGFGFKDFRPETHDEIVARLSDGESVLLISNCSELLLAGREAATTLADCYCAQGNWSQEAVVLH